MLSVTFPWSSAVNYPSGPDVGTATKVVPTANQFIRGTPATAQTFDYLLNERDTFAQNSSPLTWQSPLPTTGYYSGAWYDSLQGVWLLGTNPTGGGATAFQALWNPGTASNNSAPITGSSYGTTQPMTLSYNSEHPGAYAVISTGSPGSAGTAEVFYFGPAGTGLTHAYTVTLVTSVTCAELVYVPSWPMLYAMGSSSGWSVLSGLASPSIVASSSVASTQVMARSSGTTAIFASSVDPSYVTTTDGHTFVTRAFPSAMNIGPGTLQYQLAGITWHSSILGSVWVANVAKVNTSAISTWISLDAITWTQQSSLVVVSTHIGAVIDLASAGHHLAAVCAFVPSYPQTWNTTLSRILTSEDLGVTWHMSPGAVLGDLNPRIYSGNGQFYVTGGGSAVFSDKVIEV